nr:hypothetical protein [Tanacetum cinerariifolium]
LFQQLLKKRRKHFAAKRAEEKRNKPPTQAQKRKIMCNYLKNIEGYKLKDLKLKEFDKIQEMFDRAFKQVNTFEDFRTKLVERKEKRAGEELIQKTATYPEKVTACVTEKLVIRWKVAAADFVDSPEKTDAACLAGLNATDAELLAEICMVYLLSCCWVIIIINPLYLTTVSFGVDAAMDLKKNTLSV